MSSVILVIKHQCQGDKGIMEIGPDEIFVDIYVEYPDMHTYAHKQVYNISTLQCVTLLWLCWLCQLAGEEVWKFSRPEIS